MLDCILEGLEPFIITNNLMDLTQPSDCTFCYLELKFGKECATMELTKSEQIRIGLQKSFQSGKSAKASTVCYGYHVSPFGELVVDPAEAEIVAFIFERFSKGDSLGKISDALDRKHVDSPTGKEVWGREAISKLLENEKYTGDVVLGKTHVVDGVQVKSHDVDKQVLMKGHHPAIISHKLFRTVQQEKRRRSKRRAAR